MQRKLTGISSAAGLMAVLLGLNAQAELYKCPMANGGYAYSGEYCAGALKQKNGKWVDIDKENALAEEQQARAEKKERERAKEERESKAIVDQMIKDAENYSPPPIRAQASAKTPYGSCLERAETYQRRYESSMQSKDLVCYQKALEREMKSSDTFSCPRSAQHYQTRYETLMGASDLICYQQALERELRY